MTSKAVRASVCYMPTKVIHGAGTSRLVPELLAQKGFKKTLLVTDRGVRKAGLIQPIASSLLENGIDCVVFDDVEIDPSIECVAKGVDLIARNGIDSVVVVGGGSPICAAKGIAVAATNRGSVKDFEGLNKATTAPLSVFALPTTAGSGSEVSPVFLIKDYRSGRKFSCKGNYHPETAILDPLLLLSLPYWQAVCSSLDALAHAVDAYCSKNATAMTDALVLGSIEIMWKHLFQAAATDSIESREQMLLASSMANFACGNAGLALIHGASYGLHTLAHGYACGLVLPFALEYNLPVVTEKMARLARVMGVSDVGLSAKALADEALKNIKLLYTELGFPNRLSEDEVPSANIPELVELTMKSYMMAFNVRRPTENDMTQFFEKLYSGWEI